MKKIFYPIAVIATVEVAAYGVFLFQQKNSVTAFSDLILSEVETLAGNEAGDKDDESKPTCTVTYNCTFGTINTGSISCTGTICSRGLHYSEKKDMVVGYVTCDGITTEC